LDLYSALSWTNL